MVYGVDIPTELTLCSHLFRRTITGTFHVGRTGVRGLGWEHGRNSSGATLIPHDTL
jgi:hypothetical protein